MKKDVKQFWNIRPYKMESQVLRIIAMYYLTGLWGCRQYFYVSMCVHVFHTWHGREVHWACRNASLCNWMDLALSFEVWLAEWSWMNGFGAIAWGITGVRHVHILLILLLATSKSDHNQAWPLQINYLTSYFLQKLES